MSREGDHARVRAKDGRRDGLPVAGVLNPLVQNVVDRHGVGRNRPAGIYETGAARHIQTPWAGPVTHNVLPPDLADVLRAGSGRLQVDDADALG